MLSFSAYARAGCKVCLIVAVAAGLSSFASAADISIDWFGGSAAGTGAGNQTQMLPTDVAGFVPRNNWNSFLGEPNTGTAPLILNDGSASGATANWSHNNDWDTNIAETTADHKMMLGYLDNTDTSIINVNITGLPASVTTGGYLVYLYYDGDNGTQTRVGKYTVGGISQWGKDVAQTSFTGTFTLGQTLIDPTLLTGGAIDNAPANVLDTVPAGNYMVFGPFTGADIALTAQASLSSGGTNRGGINGMQIVQIPEPSTVALLAIGALGGLGLFLRRRAR